MTEYLKDNSVKPATVGGLLQSMIDEGTDGRLGIEPIGTGFTPLDFVLEGGLLPHELVLLGGLPGAGKTLTALQWARSFAGAGRPVTFLTYELDQLTLLGRLLIQELATTAVHLDTTQQIEMRKQVNSMMLGTLDLHQVMQRFPEVKEAMESLHSAAGTLNVVQASTQTTDAAAVHEIAAKTLEPGGILVVDYLQKVPVFEANSLKEQVHRATEELKEIAVAEDLTVLALAAVAEGGIGIRRLRLSQLRGSDSLAHECDLAMVLNEKSTATSDRHTAFDLTKMAEAKGQIVLSIEKNRRGTNDIHLEFKKDFANFRLHPKGQFITEALADGEHVVA